MLEQGEQPHVAFEDEHAPKDGGKGVLAAGRDLVEAFATRSNDAVGRPVVL
jgi:hypothetical protein